MDAHQVLTYLQNSANYRGTVKPKLVSPLDTLIER